MVYEGLVRLVQGNAAVLALCPIGGFADQLPKDFVLPAWIYKSVSLSRDYTLTGAGTNSMRYQVDCFGDDALAAVNLSKAVDDVLGNFHGTLTDSDSTLVDSCLLADRMTFFDEAARSFRVMTEYTIWYF